MVSHDDMNPPSPDDASPHHRPVLRYFIVATGVLFAIVAGFYGLENFGGQRAWDQEKARLEAAGESLDLADFFPDPSSVPDQENGATLPIFDDKPAIDGPFDPAHVFEWGIPHDANPRWDEGRPPALKALVAALTNRPPNESALTSLDCANVLLDRLKIYDAPSLEIDEALSRPYFLTCGRGIASWDSPCAGWALSNYARTASLRAVCRIQADQHSDAAREISTLLRTSRLKPSTSLWSSQESNKVLSLAIETLWFGLTRNRWTSPELTDLDSDLASINPRDRLIQALRGERADFCSVLDAFAGNRLFAVRRVSEFVQEFRGLGFNSGFGETFDLGILSSMVRALPDGSFHHNQVTFSREIDRILVAITTGSYSKLPDYRTRSHSPHNCFAYPILEGIPDTCQKVLQTEAILAQARTAIAIELFRQSSGHLPASLAELSPAPPPDPMTGAPLLYQRVDDTRYKLWSVATNGLDDGGETGPSSSTARALDWVWQSWINQEFEKAGD